MNVLIVDDSKAMQNIITKSMKSVGYMNDTYSYASDGEEALRMIRNGSHDLVLCDMHMPKMTGVDLLRALRNENNHTRMIIVSIDDDPKTIANITALGGDAYLKKPFTSDQLFNTITGLMGKIHAEKTVSVISTPAPDKQVLERALSSLAASDVQLTAMRFSDIDFSRSPFYGGTFQDDQGTLIMSMFMDVLAANTIAAIIDRHPLKEAAEAAAAGRIDTDAKQALLAFLGLFSALCKPTASGHLLDIHAEQFAPDGTTHLYKHLSPYADLAVVYSMNCGPCRGGMIFSIAL